VCSRPGRPSPLANSSKLNLVRRRRSAKTELTSDPDQATYHFKVANRSQYCDAHLVFAARQRSVVRFASDRALEGMGLVVTAEWYAKLPVGTKVRVTLEIEP
jgi:hypothetical protein